MSIAALTRPILQEDELECFVRCSGCYYRMCGDIHQTGWRQAVQQSVDLVVREIYSLPPTSRTMVAVMNSVQRNWPQDMTGFESGQHYEQIKRMATKQLMVYLTNGSVNATPFFLCHPLSVYVKELDIELFMLQQVVEWHDPQLIIRKYMTTANVELVKAYCHLSVVFAYEAFRKLPSRIELYSVLNGKSFAVCPDAEDIDLSLDYLRLTLGLMKERPELREFYQ